MRFQTANISTNIRILIRTTILLADRIFVYPQPLNIPSVADKFLSLE